MGGDCFSQAWGSALEARAYSLLLHQKKVAKEKATPGSAPLRGSLRYSAGRAACQNSPAAQTRQADCPRPASVAQRLSRGPPERRPGSASKTKNSLLRSTAKNGQKSNSLRHRFSTGRLSGPLERCRATQAGADQGRALSEGEARVAQPPRQPSSAGYRRSRHRPRGGLFFGYFLLATQKKVRPPARRNPMPIKAACMSTKEPSKC